MDNPYVVKTVFTLVEAANAIAGVIRQTREYKQTCDLVFTELVYAIKAGQLPAKQATHYVNVRVNNWAFDDYPKTIREAAGTDWERTTITRTDLIVWCESRNLRPPLLFPAEKPLHGSERDTLLAIIGALAELHGIKASKGAYRKEASALLKAFSERGINEPCGEKTIACHLKEAFKSR